jgi:hypothetical protein
MMREEAAVLLATGFRLDDCRCAGLRVLFRRAGRGCRLARPIRHQRLFSTEVGNGGFDEPDVNNLGTRSVQELFQHEPLFRADARADVCNTLYPEVVEAIGKLRTVTRVDGVEPLGDRGLGDRGGHDD